MPKQKKQNDIILSGIMPTGVPHIGNYLGAIRHWVKCQNQGDKVFVMIADLHAITTPQNPEDLQKRTLELAEILIACGIDPNRSTLFLQSHVPAHSELGWIFNTMTPLGELERMTQFKEKRENASVCAGLLNYPTLQAADILLYQPTRVPVGNDQLQHLELTRTIARKFNNRFGETFTLPMPLPDDIDGRIMGLDDPLKKMSKSATNSASYISLLDASEEIRKKIKNAVTDSDFGKKIMFAPGESGKLAITNLIAIMGAFSDKKPYTEEIEKKYENKGYAEFKNDLAELIVRSLAPIQETYHKLAENHKATVDILKQGAKIAAKAAEKTLNDVKEKMGFVIA